MDFNDRLVVVTGGGSGIGAACVAFIAARGGKVVVADKNLAAAEAVAADCGGHALALDIGDEAKIRTAAEEIQGRFGTPHALVNCAGVLQRTLPPDELSMKEWDLVLHIDLRGNYLCCAIFGHAMARQGRGAIVNIASIAGMRSGPLHAYGPAKAAVISMTECLAAEWGGKGVRVNSVSPGFTSTPALAKGMELKVMDRDAMAGSSALRRLVAPAEVASAAAFLISDFASGITGINVPVDAGCLVATPWASYGGLRQ